MSSNKRRMAAPTVVGLGLVILIGTRTSVAAAMLPASVRVGIQMTTLAFPRYAENILQAACGSGLDDGTVASFSPDGKKFVIVVKRGDVKLGVNRYSMLLWETDRLGSERPTVLLTMDSADPNPAIDPTTVAWTRDGRAIAFLGGRPGEARDVYKLNVSSRKLERLTGHKTSVISYSMDADGNRMAYEAMPVQKGLWNEKTMREGLWVSTQSLEDIMSGMAPTGIGQLSAKLFVGDRHGTREIAPAKGSSFFATTLMSSVVGQQVFMSPDGRHLVVSEVVPNSEIPAIWWQYKDATINTLNKVRGSRKAWHGEGLNATDVVPYFTRYVLVDLVTSKSRTLLNVPNVLAPSPPVIWSQDSRSVIVSHTLLPIDGRNTEIASNRTTVEIDVKTGTVVPVGQNCLQAVSWDAGGLECFGREPSSSEVAANRSEQCPGLGVIRFRQVGGRWTSSAEVPQAVDVFLKEGLNSPPKLYYRLRGAEQAKELLDLNPELSHVRLSTARLVTWEWSKGHSITGGLYYPTNYSPGRLYPLVIQTHVFNPHRFAYWGGFSTSPTRLNLLPPVECSYCKCTKYRDCLWGSKSGGSSRMFSERSKYIGRRSPT